MTLKQNLDLLPAMAVKDLRLKYAEVFGDQANTHNKDWLVKRIAWRLQAQNEGGLSERARQRAQELANEADLRVLAPASSPAPSTTTENRDQRLPAPGSIITRTYKGQTYSIEVLANGFCWNDTNYKTLTAVAEAITGMHLNGYAFFQIGKEKAQ
jgi:Protein of unknown function (DUF2924)